MFRCTTDEVAITDVKYTTEMDRAYASAHAFKFADNEDMWFKCTVSICMKMQNITSNGHSDDACETVKVNFLLKNGFTITRNEKMLQFV